MLVSRLALTNLRSTLQVPDCDEARSQMYTCAVIGRKLIWFHHILSTTKRKAVVKWAAELELGGYSKPGYPGVLIVEGGPSKH